MKRAIWKFSNFPALPLYYRCNPTDLLPCFRNPISSTTSTVMRHHQERHIIVIYFIVIVMDVA